jgi:phosphopantothenate-cysteine ligase/phosphopantothenoylcysteine decarboxylase/phosphopantothenate--cysteine ligase
MRLLVTTGNTQMPIDRARCITNVFTGRTGTRIALEAYERGHDVLLITSHPELASTLSKTGRAPKERWQLRTFRGFDDLEKEMEASILQGEWEGIIHCAAVSDYRSGGIYAPAPGTEFRQADGRWTASGYPGMVDKSAAKVKSDEPELWLRLLRTTKLVDRVRRDWRFHGILVKFKLEVGIDADQLLEIAERSRRRSSADLMVANTLETMAQWAYLGPLGGQYQRVKRQELAPRLIEAVEQLHDSGERGQ